MALPRRLLRLFLCCLASSFCNAWCEHHKPIAGLHGCIYKGHYLPLNTALDVDCMFCKCNKFGSLRCCRLGGGAIPKVPERCIVVMDGCFPKIVMRNDHMKLCNADPVSESG